MTSLIAIGVDLGGTNLKVAAVDRHGRVAAARAVPSDVSRGPEHVIAQVVTLLESVVQDVGLSRTAVVGVGVGAPGPLDRKMGCIVQAANLPGWKDVPVRDRLIELLQLPVLLDNDGNAAAFGEFWAGRNRTGQDLVMLTLGTGVGAGAIIDGKLLHGHFENAAELGHTIVALDGLPCGCGQRGCLEQYASASGIVRRVTSAIKNGEHSIMTAKLMSSERLLAQDVVHAARSGDQVCSRVWDQCCVYLAIACINIQHTYNPARVVLGGGLSEVGSFLLDHVVGQIRRRTWNLHQDVPSIELPSLGPNAGVIGAAGLAWQAAGQPGSQ